MLLSRISSKRAAIERGNPVMIIMDACCCVVSLEFWGIQTKKDIVDEESCQLILT